MFEFKLRERGDVVLADLAGRLTYGGNGAKAVRVLIDEILASGRRKIVLDLAGLEYLDSFGLGELVGAFRTVEGMGGKLKILNARGKVYDTLSLARLLPLFEVFESEEECLRSLAGPAETPQREVRSELRDAVAVVTLDRPRRANALTRHMLSELVAALEAVRGERKVRAIVVTGAGRSFCYGADTDELHEGGGALPSLDLFQTVVREIATIPKPVVAAINGQATGAGFDLALAADLRVMAAGARLSSAYLRFGLVPDGGSTHLLPRLVGGARAAELVLAGRSLCAEEALAWGLVNRVVPAGEVVEQAVEWAAELGRGPLRAYARAKHLLHSSPTLDLAAALAAEAIEQRASLEDSEFREGLRAYVEKRPPKFPE